MNLNKRSIEDVVIEKKRVLIRVDFNVPMNADGKVSNNNRIVESLPTIKYCIDKKASLIILISHLGRPDGKVDKKYSLKPVADELRELVESTFKLMKANVIFVDECVGPKVTAACNEAAPGSIILLENLRFHPEEEGTYVNGFGEKVRVEKDDRTKFRANLTKLGDVFVNDAFGTAHRAHSSMVGISINCRVSGFLLKKELEYFSKALDCPTKPFLAILGGAKIHDKIQLIKNMLKKVDVMIIGGGMAFTFLKMRDEMKIGSSLFDEEGSKIVGELLVEAKANNVQIHLPTDFVIADSFSAGALSRVVEAHEGIPDGWMGLDIGPNTINTFQHIIDKAKTTVWNGPPGVFEFEPFSKGSQLMAEALRANTINGGTTIVGGGETATVALKWAGKDTLSHISTGGGAALELLEGKVLPGVDALMDKE